MCPHLLHWRAGEHVGGAGMWGGCEQVVQETHAGMPPLALAFGMTSRR